MTKSGEWSGEWDSGKPVLEINGELHNVDWMLKNLGIEIHKPSTKTTVTQRYEEHGDLEEQEPDGDYPESGDGDGESPE